MQADLDAAAGLAALGKTDEAIAAYRRILKDTPALTARDALMRLRPR